MAGLFKDGSEPSGSFKSPLVRLKLSWHFCNFLPAWEADFRELLIMFLIFCHFHWELLYNTFRDAGYKFLTLRLPINHLISVNLSEFAFFSSVEFDEILHKFSS